jgi:hypothetical protein
LTGATFREIDFSPWRVLTEKFPAVDASSKLEVLKRQQFNPTGRDQRIQHSLAAVGSAQPTNLDLESWKAIVEEVEDEDED